MFAATVILGLFASFVLLPEFSSGSEEEQETDTPDKQDPETEAPVTGETVSLSAGESYDGTEGDDDITVDLTDQLIDTFIGLLHHGGFPL